MTDYLLDFRRDLSGVLSGLTKVFNVDKFMNVFLDSLIQYRLELYIFSYARVFSISLNNNILIICSYSLDDDVCHRFFLSVIESVPLKSLVTHIVSKVLHNCLKKFNKKSDASLSESGLF